MQEMVLPVLAIPEESATFWMEAEPQNVPMTLVPAVFVSQL